MQLDRCGSTRGHNHRRPTGGEAQPESHETRSALVEDDMQTDPVLGGQGGHERRRPRSGRDHRVGHTRAGPLVTEDRAESGLLVPAGAPVAHAVTPFTSGSAPLIRESTHEKMKGCCT